MYRVVLESLLGLQIVGGRVLVLRPCIPDGWPGFTIDYRLPDEETQYEIQVVNPNGLAGMAVAGTMDGVPCGVEKGAVRAPLLHDGRRHRIEVTLGRAEVSAS
jgi:cyclic beta-1,2-glucan synthetase